MLDAHLNGRLSTIMQQQSRLSSGRRTLAAQHAWRLADDRLLHFSQLRIMHAYRLTRRLQGGYFYTTPPFRNALCWIGRCVEGSEAAHRVRSCVQDTTNSPILWDAEFRDLQLAGSPTLPLAREREAAIRKEWEGITAGMLASGSEALKDDRYNEQAFLQAFAVVLAHAIYLPSAQCFALLPYVSFMQRTGNDNGCTVDYDVGAGLPASHVDRAVLVMAVTYDHHAGLSTSEPVTAEPAAPVL